MGPLKKFPPYMILFKPFHNFMAPRNSSFLRHTHLTLNRYNITLDYVSDKYYYQGKYTHHKHFFYNHFMQEALDNYNGDFTEQYINYSSYFHHRHILHLQNTKKSYRKVLLLGKHTIPVKSRSVFSFNLTKKRLTKVY